MSHDFPTSKHETRIEDVPPKRNRDFADLLHALFAVLVGAAVILFSIYLHGTTSGVESDVRSAGHVVSWLMDVPTSLLQQIAIVFITVSVLIQLLIAKEWLQSVVSAIALILGFAAIWGISALISGSGNDTLIMSMMSNGTSVGTGLLPDFYAAMASFLTVAGPRRTRSGTKWGWNILYTVAVLFVVLSWNSLSGVLVSFAAGRALGMLIRFMLGTQTNGAWGNQVAQALRSIGIDVASLSRRLATYTDSGMLKTTLDDDLTENSRIYDAIDVDGHQYTVSVLDNQVHMAGYLNQLWQWVRLTGVSMRRDRSSFDAIHHHYAMILGLQNAGLTVPGVYGVADSSESSILVFHRDHMPLECNPNTMSDHDMELFMTYLSEAHRHGFTHRRITPETLSRMENGQPVIAGWQNGDYGSAPPNYALDKVQLLVLLGALNGIDRAIACARRTWGDEQLIDLAPFIQKAAVPAAIRALPACDKHMLNTLRSRIAALAPQEVADSMETVTLSRFSFRSFIAIALLVVAVYVVFTQIQPAEMIKAVKEANIAMALVCNPEILICDEPTTALDVTIQAQVLSMMSDLRDKLGTAMIMITHDLGIVAQVCDKVAVMYAGQIIESGTLEDIFTSEEHHPYTKGLFGAIPNLKVDARRLSPIEGLMPDPSNLPSGCHFHDRCPHCMDICREQEPAIYSNGTHCIACHLYDGWDGKKEETT